MCDLDQNSLDNLSNIKKGVLKRRLGMEAQSLKETCSSISISIDENKGLPIINVVNEIFRLFLIIEFKSFFSKN